MPDPITGVVTPPASPASAQAPGQGAASSAPAQGAASAPADTGKEAAGLKAALIEERGKRQELQAEVENLKTMYNQFPQQNQPYQAPYQPYQPPAYQQPYPTPPVNIKDHIDALYQEDIRKGFQAEMTAMMQYRDWVDTKVEGEFDGLRGKSEDFTKYEPKVRQYVRSLPYDARSQANIVQATYLMVKGQDSDNIIKAREAEFQKKYGAAAGAVGLGGTFSAPQAGEGSKTLSSEERGAAQAMGMSDEEYLKYRG
jgi:hypothetical protein